MKPRLNGEELRLIRTLRNARVVDVANVIDRASSAVCYVEAGNRDLDEIQSQAVMNAFNVDEDLLQMIRRTIKLSKI
ncbi:hypothetical protein [Priestia flexa]|uniref:hypothetical protein n=1 Tax=Priestia flexa TaxID=86664 RepID=UPI00099C47DE|nr:hypothetical protein [Priestia flexa]AQX56042.1 hypothetical protein BC359_18180 [Priestia flexa]